MLTPLSKTSCVVESLTSKPSAILIGWGARAVYVGPGFGLPAHRNAVGILALALSTPMRVAINPQDLSQGFRACRSVLIEPMKHHLIDTGSHPQAFIYLDALSEDLAVLRKKCKHPSECFSFDLNNEAELIDLLRTMSMDADTWRRGEPALASALGFVPRHNDPRIATLVRMMLERPNDERLAEDWAREVGLSSSRFQHLFKEQVGLSFRRFRLWARMRIALRLALRGASLTEAALEAGLSSSAHLSAAFKGMFGISPSQLIRAAPMYLET
jgi:AraC-like DNA-binding protein